MELRTFETSKCNHTLKLKMYYILLYFIYFQVCVKCFQTQYQTAELLKANYESSFLSLEKNKS